MNTRIRYVKSGEGLTSLQIFETADASYRTVIDSSGRGGSIISLRGGESLVATVSATSPHKVKIKLKDKLKELGVVFESERRKSDDGSSISE